MSRKQSKTQSLNAKQREERRLLREFRCYCGNGVWDHDWRLKSDWEGDPSIPNGTRSWKFLRCCSCGEESMDEELIADFFSDCEDSYDDSYLDETDYL